MFNSVLRFILIAYQSMILNALISVDMAKQGEADDITLYSGIGYLVALFGFLIFQVIFLYRNKKNLNHP